MLHLWAGLTLPLPVGDEVAFYWPSLSLAERGTLLAPSLNPHRVLEWMPPGYMTTLAGWMHLAGPGLMSARWLSWGLSAIAMGLWISLIRMLLAPVETSGSARWAWPAACALTLWAGLSRHWLVMGNMARMEGLLLVVALLGWHAALAGRWLAFLTLTALSLLIHPNGIYFGLIGFGLWVWQRPPVWRPFRLPSPRLWEWGLALLTCLLWGGYSVQVFGHWENFVHDWQHQLSLRSPRGLSLLLWRPDTALFLIMWVGAVWALRRGRQSVHIQGREGAVALLWVAMGLFITRVVGQGWVYGVFSIMAVTVTAAIAGTLGLRWALDRWQGASNDNTMSLRQLSRWGAVPLVGLPLVAAGVLSVPFLTDSYRWQGMRPSGFGYSFITREDITALHQILTGLYDPTKGEAPTPVYVIEAGEGILLNPRDTGRWRAVLPAFGGTLPRYYLIHQSPANAFNQPTIDETLLALELESLPAPIYTRDGERWYLLAARPGHLPVYIRSMQNTDEAPPVP